MKLLQVQRAIALSASLQDTQCPHSCPACFRIVALELYAAVDRRRSPLLEELRDNHPAFWDSCIAFVTTRRATNDLPALRHQLHQITIACQHHADHSTVDGHDLTDPVLILVDALYVSLDSCLTRGAHPMAINLTAPKGFGSKHGRWPESASKLFPLGERQTVDMHVFWCTLRFSLAPLAFLANTLRFARSLALPALLGAQASRAQLVYVVAQMLHANFADVPEHWHQELPLQPAADPNLPLASKAFGELLCRASVNFLNVASTGPDAKRNDFFPFFAGYGFVMSQAMLAASRGLCSSDAYFQSLAVHVLLLHSFYKLPMESVDERGSRSAHNWRTKVAPT